MKLTKKELVIVGRMKALGVYKPEFEETIRRYRKLSDEFNALYAKYKKADYPFIHRVPRKAPPSLRWRR